MSSLMGGGKFKHGFLSAAFTAGASVNGVFGPAGVSSLSGKLQNAFSAALVGGTASVLSGSKFANGAITGAFSRMFNDLAEVKRNGFKSEDEAGIAALNEAWDKTLAEKGIEYGGLVYLDSDTLEYGYTVPITSGELYSIDLSTVQVPDGARAIGRYHTHAPDGPYELGSTQFNPRDASVAKANYHDSYVGSTAGVKKYTFETGVVTLIGSYRSSSPVFQSLPTPHQITERY
jgi:hypothetical protein